MPDYRCTKCQVSVPAAEAHVRSVNFRTVAWCRPCWILRVPEQRRPESEKVAR